jgi:peptidoglycan/LPS O-acetylase OafA/YrhL
MTSPPNNATTSAQLPALTSLRFVAAFAVLLLHYRDLLGPLPPWLRQGIVGGQYGVTFFFVLSGFILTYRYHGWFAGNVTESAYWRFQRLRLARIYPIYVLGLLLDTPWHLIERARSGQLAEVGPTYWASWLLNLVGLQAWVPAVPYAMFWNTPAWSVAAEFFFYATFPWVTLVLTKRLRSTASLVLALFVVIIVGTLLYALVLYALNYRFVVQAETQYIAVVYNPLLRYSEFMAGCLAGQYFVRTRSATQLGAAGAGASVRGRSLLVCACLIAVVARIASPAYTGPSAAWWLFDVSIKYSVFILPFVALILAVASGPTWFSRVLEQRWLVLLGEASYALYIVHWSGVTFLHLGFLRTLGTPWVHAAFLLGTVGVSVLCYLYIEVPCRLWLRGTKREGAGAET